MIINRSYSSGIKVTAKSFIDLQTHTTLSDGKWKPHALIDYFVQEQFSIAAITDHDRVDSVASVQTMAHTKGFHLLVAVEMTTQWRDKSIDILCFGFEKNTSHLQTLCDELMQIQSETSRGVYNYLVEVGHIKTYDETELQTLITVNPAVQVQSIVDIFHKHNTVPKPDYTLLRDGGYKLCAIATSDVIEAIHKSGGVALIAHPGRTDDYLTFDETVLDEFRDEIAIDGIEVYYPLHSQEQIKTYQMYAEKHNLLISAGSDSHSQEKPPIKYPAYYCEALLDRLDIKLT